MVRTLALIAFATLGAAWASEKPVKMKDLPDPVQKAIQDQTKGAQIRTLTMEIGNGKTLYEAETILDGRSRDVTFDSSGALVELEQEVTLDKIPAPAKTALEAKARGGKITRVEAVMTGETTTYEAIVIRRGKKSEVAVRADGSVVK